MPDNKDAQKGFGSILAGIESQLEHLLSEKREIEKELEEKIREEKEEAKKKVERIEKEFEALTNNQNIIAEVESKKENIKSKIKERLNKAIQLQTEIENLTGQTLEELKEVRELNKKFEEFNKEAEEKISFSKKELEEKFGIAAEVPEGIESGEIGVDLENELAKLKKIKEMLRTGEAVQPEREEPEKEEKVEDEGKPIDKAEESVEEDKLPLEMQDMSEGMESSLSETDEAKEEEVIEEASSEEREEISPPAVEGTFQNALEILEKYRKVETPEGSGEVYYYQNNDKRIIDSEYLVSTLSDHLEEVKKLYTKFSQTESPKDQFILKQEIIEYQEALRRVFLGSIGMLQKESCALPKYTLEILNMDILQEILEKLGVENWSNQEEFTFFSQYAEKLKNDFQARITPPTDYLNLIIRELEI